MFMIFRRENTRYHSRRILYQKILAVSIFIAFAYAAPMDDQSSVLVTAAEKGDINLVRSLLEQKVGADAEGKYGWTALMRAASHNYIEIVKLFLGVKTGVSSKDRTGQTFLWFAAHYGDAETIRILKDAGAKE